eukprot:6210193-Pleurochrysis_carterae.AAC.1
MDRKSWRKGGKGRFCSGRRDGRGVGRAGFGASQGFVGVSHARFASARGNVVSSCVQAKRRRRLADGSQQKLDAGLTNLSSAKLSDGCVTPPSSVASVAGSSPLKSVGGPHARGAFNAHGGEVRQNGESCVRRSVEHADTTTSVPTQASALTASYAGRGSRTHHHGANGCFNLLPFEALNIPDSVLGQPSNVSEADRSEVASEAQEMRSSGIGDALLMNSASSSTESLPNARDHFVSRDGHTPRGAAMVNGPQCASSAPATATSALVDGSAVANGTTAMNKNALSAFTATDSTVPAATGAVANVAAVNTTRWDLQGLFSFSDGAPFSNAERAAAPLPSLAAKALASNKLGGQTDASNDSARAPLAPACASTTQMSNPAASRASSSVMQSQSPLAAIGRRTALDDCANNSSGSRCTVMGGGGGSCVPSAAGAGACKATASGTGSGGGGSSSGGGNSGGCGVGVSCGGDGGDGSGCSGGGGGYNGAIVWEPISVGAARFDMNHALQERSPAHELFA